MYTRRASCAGTKREHVTEPLAVLPFRPPHSQGLDSPGRLGSDEQTWWRIELRARVHDPSAEYPLSLALRVGASLMARQRYYGTSVLSLAERAWASSWSDRPRLSVAKNAAARSTDDATNTKSKAKGPSGGDQAG